jgi:NrS-1  polymerase HBD domain
MLGSGVSHETDTKESLAARWENVPEELQQRPQWCVWRYEDHGKPKPDKVPYNPATGRKARANDPRTFTALARALGAFRSGRYEGIGFLFTEEDPYCGIDLDHCRDPQTGRIEEWARAVMARFPHWYWEGSPSGTGVHGIGRGTLPVAGKKRGNSEVYTSKRFLTVTGQHLAGPTRDLHDQTPELTTWYAEVFEQKEQQENAQEHRNGLPALTDEDLLARCRRAKDAARFTTLWRGDWSDYPSQSEADLALCNLLAFFSGPDPATIDRLFRQSGLYREKWDATHFADGRTYGQETIRQAITGRTDFSRKATPQQKPEIRITTEMTKVVDATQQAILTLPGGPHVYQRARQLCRIARGCPPPKWLHRPPDAPVITLAGPAALRELANKGADYLKYDKRQKVWEPALPPIWAIETLQDRDAWEFPLLEAIVCAPTLRVDGEIIATPGYDADTGLYLDMRGIPFPEVKPRPGLDDARAALEILLEPFADFPFSKPEFSSAALAAVLSLVARPAIASPIPLFAVRANTRGTGKGLLIDTVVTAATGRPAPRWPQVLDENEERKRLLTIGLSGDATTHIDNVVAPLGSAPLDAALTANTLEDRLLGQNKSARVPITCVFFASGNQMTFRGDMARRVVPIDLEALMEKPEERTGFQHTPLLPWVKEQHPRLVTAALTVLRAYVLAGCPSQGVVLGSFEAWSDLVRQALLWCGQPDPCEGRTNIEAESDEDYQKLSALLLSWHACYGTQARTLKQVIDDSAVRAPSAPALPNEWNRLSDALAEFDSKYDGKQLDTKRIGKAFRSVEKRVIGNLRLIRAPGGHGGVIEWRVLPPR